MLKRSYQDSLAIFSDSSKEIFVAVAEGKVVGFVIVQMQGAFDRQYSVCRCVHRMAAMWDRPSPDRLRRGTDLFGNGERVYLCLLI